MGTARLRPPCPDSVHGQVMHLWVSLTFVSFEDVPFIQVLPGHSQWHSCALCPVHVLFLVHLFLVE